MRLLGGPGFDVTVLTATLGSSPAMTFMPSLVASNIQPISMAESRLRCLLFLRQHWRTCSSNDLQAMAFRINFSVSVMARPQKFQISDKAIESFPWQLTSSIELDRRHDWILLGFYMCFEFTVDSFEYLFFAVILRSVVSLLEQFASRKSNKFLGLYHRQNSWGCMFSPSWCICWEAHWRYIHSVDKTSPILCWNLPLPNSCSASCTMN